MSRQFSDLFDQLYRDYAPMVKQVCTGFLNGDRALAEDLAHDVFINVWNALSKFRGEANYKTWIYRITVNSCLQYLRKPGKTAGFASEQLENLRDQDIDAAVAGREQVNELYRAIGQLGEVDKLLIMMVLDELEYDQIASVMGISEATLRVKIHRIKQRIKNFMSHAG